MSTENQQPIAGAFFWNGRSFEQLDPTTTPLGTPSRHFGHFGPEISFARTMRENGSNVNIYLIKYSSGGKALDSGWVRNQVWSGDPPGPNRWNFYPGLTSTDTNKGICYTQMLDKIKTALRYLNGQDTAYVIKGFVWMQGEQDSKNITSATRYAQNLKRLSIRLHEDLGLTNTIPFVYGQVLPYTPPAARFTYRDKVRQSQKNADADSGHHDSFPNAYMVSTDTFPVDPVDLVHYTTEGQMLLGRNLAVEMSRALGY